MTADPDRQHYWCLEHRRVETPEDRCASSNRLGPYDTQGQAERALQTVAERNRKFDDEDQEWETGPRG